MTYALVVSLVTFVADGTNSNSFRSPTLVAAADEEKINGVPLSLLITGLGKKEDRQQRCRAMEEVARYAKNPAPHIRVYLEALKDRDEVVRATSAQCLGWLGQRLPSLVDEFLPGLDAAFADPQQQVRAAVAQALSDIGPAARSELPALKRRFEEDKSPDVRRAALGAIVSVSRGSDDYLDALVRAIDQDEFALDTEWLRALSTVGAKSDKAAAAFRNTLHRKSVQQDVSWAGVRHRAVSGLGTLGATSAAAVPDLFEIMNEPIKYRDVAVARGAGEPAQPAAPTQEPANFGLRLITAWAITRIDPSATARLLDVLAAQLSDANADMRLSSAIVANRLGYLPQAKALAPIVQKLVDDKDPNVRAIARLAVLRLADPKTTEQDETILSDVPLPKEPATVLDAKDMKARLKAKLAEVSERCASGDGEGVMRGLLVPTHLERAFIQGDLRTQVALKGNAWLISMKELLDRADAEKIEITGAHAVVPTGSASKPLRFHWFAGDWYLLENG